MARKPTSRPAIRLPSRQAVSVRLIPRRYQDSVEGQPPVFSKDFFQNSAAFRTNFGPVVMKLCSLAAS